MVNPKIGIKYKVIGHDVKFKVLGHATKELYVVEFDNQNQLGFASPLNIDEMKEFMNGRGYNSKKYIHLLKRDKYYHTIDLEWLSGKKFKIARIRNTKLARKLNKKAKENGKWLNLK